VRSRLEVMEFDGGTCELAHRAGDRIEAPNWSRDGGGFFINGLL